MRQINVAVIGPGWCGGIRANACAQHALVNELHLAEIRPDRLAEVAAETDPTSTTDNWEEYIADDSIDAVIISTTPENLHYPMTRAALAAGKHVLVEKPIATTMEEADELIAIAEGNNLKFTVGYSQRFKEKFAFVHKAINDGTIGEPVTCLVSRNVTRELGNKITGRTKLSPAAMEATHDLDFLLWCLQPRKPIRVYSQQAGKLFKQKSDTPDHQWIMVTMDDGTTITVGAGWILPLGYKNYSQCWIEVIGTEGALTIDDTHKEVQINRVDNGIQYPMSTMPGEPVDHVFAGPMKVETDRFIEAVALDRPVLVTPGEARLVMDVYVAADLSVERGEPVTLPRNDPTAVAAQ
ncbi:MAG: Gfo/Idh/MocA family oxidoreductase [Alphaproteobacteria bacterium]|nr:Gfo/Idh/MocA family oxidoreductase [Alphaproteobacteria bacterium]